MTSGTKETMRINKYLATCGVDSRRKVEQLITNGIVTVNGKVCTNLATDILETDHVEVAGKVVHLPQIKEYYMLNKPKGYVSSVKDDRGRKTVLDLIKTNARVFPVGRLDYDSEGLLLLTNDGELTYKLTHPKNEITKTYSVKIEGGIDDTQIKQLEGGVIIDNHKLSPCKISVKSSDEKLTKLEVVIQEGRNREIRKMFETIGKTVVFLKRIKIAELSLGGLNRGEYRPLSVKEVEYLKAL